MNQFMGHRNQIKLFVRFKVYTSLNVYNMIVVYTTLLSSETCTLSLICFIGFTVDNGALKRLRKYVKPDDFIFTNTVY